MARVKILVDGWKCERCDYEWVPRRKAEPKVCARCSSPYWNQPRKFVLKLERRDGQASEGRAE